MVHFLSVFRKSVVPLSSSLNDVIPADTVTTCQVPFLHLVFGRQSVDEDGLPHVVVKCQSCCTHFCGKILDPTHLLERVAPRRYLKTIKAPGEVGFGPCRMRPYHARRGSHASLGEVHLCRILFSMLLLRAVDQEIPRQCMHVHTFAAVPPVDKFRVLGIHLPCGKVL